MRSADVSKTQRDLVAAPPYGRSDYEAVLMCWKIRMKEEDRGCQSLSRQPRMNSLGGFWITIGLGIKENKIVAVGIGGD